MSSKVNNLLTGVAARVINAIANGQEIDSTILPAEQREAIELYRQSSVLGAFVTLVFNLPEGRITRTILVNPSHIALSQWGVFERNHHRQVETVGAHRSQNRYGWILEDPMLGLVNLDYAELSTEADPLTGRPWKETPSPEANSFSQLIAEAKGVGRAVLNEGQEEDIGEDSDDEEEDGEEQEDHKSVNSEEEGRLVELQPIDCTICHQSHVPELPDGDGVFQGHPIPEGLSGEPLAKLKRRITKKHSRIRISNYRKIDEEFDADQREKNRVRSEEWRKKKKDEKKEMQLKLEEVQRRLAQYEPSSAELTPGQEAGSSASKENVAKRKKK